MTYLSPGRFLSASHSRELSLKLRSGNRVERATLAGYERHAAQIVSRIGTYKLANLTKPGLNKLRDELLASMSRQHAKKVMNSLRAILKDAERRGNVAQNVAIGVGIKLNKREKPRLAPVWTSRPSTRSGASLPPPRDAGARCCSPRSSPDCGRRSFAAYRGATSI
jgi:hypothetical protein